ncbi:RuvC-like resolvase [Rhodococcus phage Whack]|uniref:RuvC-like resolvase n=1 Tax=Rhodococcus phage Whack TaxID=2591132 RepID=A0A515MKI5_9CAUD|nr:RuvC-like Holliday junction resolvase [Rhodococcus phage Whack]QDM57130.1 RuvC-like resolvase [Rhodococcus phage Whack]
MTTVVGLDPSLTAAGIAILDDPKSAATPNVPKLLTVGESGRKGATLAERAIRVGRQYEVILRSMPPAVRLVVVEAVPVHNPSPNMASLYQERAALVLRLVEFLAKRGIPVVDVNLSTLKLFATGNGRADKTQVIASMQSLWPHAIIKNDNEGDALTLASMGGQYLGWHEPELPHHYAPKVDWTGVKR